MLRPNSSELLTVLGVKRPVTLFNFSPDGSLSYCCFKCRPLHYDLVELGSLFRGFSVMEAKATVESVVFSQVGIAL